MQMCGSKIFPKKRNTSAISQKFGKSQNLAKFFGEAVVKISSLAKSEGLGATPGTLQNSDRI